MSGTIMRRTHGTRTRIVGVRLDGEERTLTAWGRISGRDPVEIRKRLEYMTPRNAIFEGLAIIPPGKAWPVPPSVLAKSRSAA